MAEMTGDAAPETARPEELVAALERTTRAVLATSPGDPDSLADVLRQRSVAVLRLRDTIARSPDAFGAPLRERLARIAAQGDTLRQRLLLSRAKVRDDAKRLADTENLVRLLEAAGHEARPRRKRLDCLG